VDGEGLLDRAAAPMLTGLTGTPMNKDAMDLEQLVIMLNHGGGWWRKQLCPPELRSRKPWRIVTKQRRVLGKKGSGEFHRIT